MTQSDFIEVYHQAVPAEVCRAIVERFEASGQEHPGLVGGGHHPDLKRSSDISISGQHGWGDVEQALNQAVFRGLLDYLRRYPFSLIAPVMLQHAPPGGTPRRIEYEDVLDLDDATLSELLMAVLRPGRINLQRYRAGEGGYPYWHCELYPKDRHAETLHRHLLWTVYLNDGFEAGETEFFHQQRKVVPRTGSLLIAPAAFTHTHRGNRPQGGDKYIATSWALFQPAEKLYGTN
ncbi:2OG-Fe(II) oxygenase [Pseudoxanthomonas sp. JBR18]|uniref:2OG-Fe(II) oxygenase n=1 Tax=Pseudoxanthomonas sp. JBR18 TaxID=2969308 RepID=UPI0023050E7F|nr:2OG-Fe(II) oxygenase [Pseudoxanthomonas sp. JBR18]WCE05769.1 2OG-Fe(II) oxygenase [Pseudoxanthomonas sp. JBR18]